MTFKGLASIIATKSKVQTLEVGISDTSTCSNTPEARVGEWQIGAICVISYRIVIVRSSPLNVPAAVPPIFSQPECLHHAHQIHTCNAYGHQVY